MKDYELDKKKKGLFVLNYEIKENKIIVNYANGDSISIDNTDENIKILDKSMKEQVNSSYSFYNKCERNFAINCMFFILGATAIIPGIFVLIFNPAQFALIQQVLLGFGGVLALTSGSAAVSKLTKMKDVLKNKKFLIIEDELNEKVKENENMLYNTHRVTKNIVNKSQDNNIVFTINNIDKVPFSDLEQIMSNIEREEKFNFEYPEVVEEKVKSKTK